MDETTAGRTGYDVCDVAMFQPGRCRYVSLLGQPGLQPLLQIISFDDGLFDVLPRYRVGLLGAAVGPLVELLA